MFDSCNIDNFSNILKKYDIDLSQSEYIVQFNNYYGNKKEYYNFIKNKLCEYFSKKLEGYEKVDINEIILNFEQCIYKKSLVIFDELGISDIINIDVKNKRNRRKRYIYEKNLYEVIFFNERKCQENKIFIDYFSSKIECVNIPSLIKLCKIIERGKRVYFREDDKLEHLNNLSLHVTELFDNDKNINKLIKYIQEYYVNEEDNIYEYELTKNKKDLNYLIGIMKGGGYIFFVNYENKIRKKYLNEHGLDIIRKDQKLVNYFIIVLKNSKKTITTTITSILSRIRNYLQDVEDCYYNLLNYRKLDVKVKSEKYKKVNTEKLERNKVYFNISRNNYLKTKEEKEESKIFNLPTDLKLYDDVLSSYYSSRYLDRSMFIDNNRSSVIFTIKFGLRKFTFNMNFYQYSILKVICKVKDVNLKKIIEKTNLEIDIIEKVLDDLLEIELIKKTDGEIENIEYKINDHFSSEKSVINIIDYCW